MSAIGRLLPGVCAAAAIVAIGVVGGGHEQPAMSAGQALESACIYIVPPAKSIQEVVSSKTDTARFIVLAPIRSGRFVVEHVLNTLFSLPSGATARTRSAVPAGGLMGTVAIDHLFSFSAVVRRK